MLMEAAIPPQSSEVILEFKSENSSRLNLSSNQDVSIPMHVSNLDETIASFRKRIRKSFSIVQNEDEVIDADLPIFEFTTSYPAELIDEIFVEPVCFGSSFVIHLRNESMAFDGDPSLARFPHLKWYCEKIPMKHKVSISTQSVDMVVKVRLSAFM